MGYSFFNVNALTLSECNLLVESFNQREKDKEREMKKNRK